MKQVPFITDFSIGCFRVECDGNGEVVISANSELKDHRFINSFAISIDELNEISDRAYAHKIAFEDQDNVDVVDEP